MNTSGQGRLASDLVDDIARTLAHARALALASDLDRISAFDLDRARAFDLDRALASAQALANNRASDPDLASAGALTSDLRRALGRARARVLGRITDLALGRARAADLASDLNFAFYLARALISARILARDLYRARARADHLARTLGLASIPALNRFLTRADESERGQGKRSEGKRVASSAAGLLAAAARLLPAADRARYREEYISELQELAKAGVGFLQQMRYALRQLRSAPEMSLALRSPRRRSAVP